VNIQVCQAAAKDRDEFVRAQGRYWLVVAAVTHARCVGGIGSIEAGHAT